MRFLRKRLVHSALLLLGVSLLAFLLCELVPGDFFDEMRLNPVHLNLDFAESFKTRRLEAYERLLMDAMRGNLTLFVRRDEQEAAWHWVEPILAAWQAGNERPKTYTAGTWGPAASSALLSRDGLTWHEEA